MKVKPSIFLLITILIIIPIFSFDLQPIPIAARGNGFVYGSFGSRIIPQPILPLQLVNHDPISINNNSELIAQAKEEEWTGNGSLSNPYLIDGLSISGVGDLITVKNTNLYFQITNCVIMSGSQDGIVLINVSNGVIVNSTIFSNVGNGIFLDGLSGSTIISNIFIVNNTIFSNDNNGILLDVGRSLNIKIRQITITNNSIYTNGNDGIYFRSDDRINPITHCSIVTNHIFGNANHGIILEAFCHNNTISQNTVFNNSNSGINLDYYNNYNTITTNTVFLNDRSGISLDDSFNCTITDNIVFSNSKNGIALGESDYGNDVGLFVFAGLSVISNNTVHSNGWGGINLAHAFRYKSIQYRDLIVNNVVYNGKGIYLGTTRNTIVTNNTLFSIIDNGIYGRTNHSTFSTNFISNCTLNGIQLDKSGNNIFTNNTFYNNNLFGLHLYLTEENTIQWNDFIGNSPAGDPQAFDDYSSDPNNFVYNFWYDWTGPDNNLDGIVDFPYPIDSMTKIPTQDPSPLVSLNNPYQHFLAKPRISFPTEDGSWETDSRSEILTIKWIHAVDFFNHSVSYDIYYSPDYGRSWSLLVANLSENFFDWNTSYVDKSSFDLLKVVATCSDGLSASDIADGPIFVHLAPDGTTQAVSTSSSESISTSNGTPTWHFSLLLASIIILIVFRRGKDVK